MGETIKKAGYDGRGISKSLRPPAVHIVSEKLCGRCALTKYVFSPVTSASNDLPDDALQRLAPYLQSEGPVDIIDLWPGAGLWSSKVYDFLQPRRHVLLEPNQPLYQALLNQHVESRPNMQLLPPQDPFVVRNWEEILAESLPDFVRSRREIGNEGAVSNDTLVVLANPPVTASKKSHYTPGRWWAMFIDDFLRGKGLHAFGPVRTIAWMSASEAYIVIPQSVCDRKRPAMLTEAAALHAFHVATVRPSESFASRDWATLAASAARAEQRAVDANVVTPAGREMEPLEMAPNISIPSKESTAYEPRPMAEWHREHAASFADYERQQAEYRELKQKLDAEKKKKGDAAKEEGDGAKKKRGGAAKLARPAMPRSVIRLAQENRRSQQIRQILNIVRQIDELNQALTDAMEQIRQDKILKDINKELEESRADFKMALSELDVKSRDKCLNQIDDWRAAVSSLSSSSSTDSRLDEAVLVWDRRPFEPLRIDPEELYPQGNPCSMFYFEPDMNSRVLRDLIDLKDQTARDQMVALLGAVLTALGPQGSMTVSAVLSVLFPERSSQEIVRAVPSLARFGSKRLDPVTLDIRENKELEALEYEEEDIDDDVHELAASSTSSSEVDDDNNVPSSFPPSASSSSSSHISSSKKRKSSKREPLATTVDIEYDFSEMRVRSLPLLVLWDLLREYHRTSPFRQDPVQLSRALGGTLTDYQAGEDDPSVWSPKTARKSSR